MVKKITKYAKFVVCCVLILSLIAPSYAALSASDGSAFVTKAEFDSALADFNARLTTFEAGINSKIDSQVTSYLDRNGIWNGQIQTLHFEINNMISAWNNRPSGEFINIEGVTFKSATTNQTYNVFPLSPGFNVLFPSQKKVAVNLVFLRNKLLDFVANKSGLLFWNYGGCGGTANTWFGGWGWYSNGTIGNNGGYFYTASYAVGLFGDNGTTPLEKWTYIDLNKLNVISNDVVGFFGTQGSDTGNEGSVSEVDKINLLGPDSRNSNQLGSGWNGPDSGMLANMQQVFGQNIPIDLGAPPRTLFCFVQKNKKYSLFAYNSFDMYLNNWTEAQKANYKFTFMDKCYCNGSGDNNYTNLDAYKWYVY